MSDKSRASADAQEERADSPTDSPQEKLDTATENEQHEQEQNTVEHEDEEQSQADQTEEGEVTAIAPPLPDEVPPPLPDEAPPGQTNDDGWEPVWDATSQSYYFYNRITKLSQWDNPRVPEQAATEPAPGTAPSTDNQEPPRSKSPVLGGYNPAIHGDYDPTASYAQQYEETPETSTAAVDPAAAYAAAGTFNRFTGRWQAQSINPENHNDENKSNRQMNAFFDVDAAANSHDGRSLRAERSAKKLSKKELKDFKEKRRERKEEKRRAWLRD
ncbi:hypothetical protein N7466_000914 [Penicillium verhagenii]|uniref:uncharacterized protein n=1 Tax=Penicillium verhagenii TaxID=1562060 RepID=UPI0025458EA6|nr:uncharacterized protein N7466_000914 [Penicillium verhagenii]KAJ5947899.1 hypothetical protein N7466_000914 [Penicillium verhagenii]